MNGNLVYDVGLHKGEDSAFYLRKGFRVVAIEANPDLIAESKQRFRDEIASEQLCIVEGAIAPAEVGDTVTFYKNEESTIWGTIDPRWAERNERLGKSSQKIELPRIDIDSVFRKHGIPFYLKIDIEGADTLVLESLKNFDERPKYVSIESEKVSFDKLENELTGLHTLGYRKFRPVQQRSIPGTRLRSRTISGDEFEHTFEECASGPFGEDVSLPWMSLDDTLRAYRDIFVQYRRFGDGSSYIGLPKVAKGVISAAYRVCTGHRGPLPGWYDTHASL